MFNKSVIEKNEYLGDNPEDDIYLHDPITDRTYVKIVSGVCPPNQVGPGYIVIAGLLHPIPGQMPHVWLIDEGGYRRIEDLLLAMSRAHYHYKVDTHYCRFKYTKNDLRVYDDFLRHIQTFNREAVKSRRPHIQATDAPWTNDRGGLKFILEKVRDELRVGNRKLWWTEPSPPSTRTLTGINEWETIDDKNTMLGALCYAVAGIIVDRPNIDSSGHIRTGSGVAKTKTTFDPMHTFNQMIKKRKE